MNYMLSDPLEYPVGELIKMLPEDIRSWVHSQNLDIKTHIEIHQLMLQARREMGIPPWHIFTAIMQAYAAAAFDATGEHVDVSCSWFACAKQRRPLDAFNHKYEDSHEIWVHTHDGEDIMVGYVVGRYDGRPVFSFWDVRTERYWLDCTKSMIIYHPYTREPILTNYGLAKWRDHVSPDGRAILPEMTRRSGKKKGTVKVNVVDAEDLPAKPVATLSEAVANQRLMLLKLFLSVIDRRVVSDRIAYSDEADEDMFLPLCTTMRDPLVDYINKLSSRKVTAIHIPDAAFLTCQSILELLKGAEGLGSVLQLWMTELVKTDTTRG